MQLNNEDNDIFTKAENGHSAAGGRAWLVLRAGDSGAASGGEVHGGGRAQ